MRPIRPRAAIALLGAAALLVVLAGCTASRAGIYPYNWGIFWDSLLRPSPRIVNGIWLTVSIAITSQIIGVILGIFGTVYLGATLAFGVREADEALARVRRLLRR